MSAATPGTDGTQQFPPKLTGKSHKYDYIKELDAFQWPTRGIRPGNGGSVLVTTFGDNTGTQAPYDLTCIFCKVQASYQLLVSPGGGEQRTCQGSSSSAWLLVASPPLPHSNKHNNDPVNACPDTAGCQTQPVHPTSIPGFSPLMQIACSCKQ